ncbi:hypothetical protein [Dokdonia sp. Asnod1-B02]|uniref:hypothetical protein n=1 Tax=Dokdonia sp. Asnod1-B02 TaxID=3160573 RepID=UPI00386D3492
MKAEFERLNNNLKFNTGFDADKDFNADTFYNIVRLFDNITDIKISFVGSFIWLEDITYGAMYQQKDLIKAIDIIDYNTARWAGKKKSWYFSPTDYSQKGKSGKTLEQLKSKFNSTEFRTSSTAKISA